MLKDIFAQAISQYTADNILIDKLWTDIELGYKTGNRNYHNITHLENILFDLTSCRGVINDWDVIIFSTCYHDIVYDVLKNDNEERSAIHAREKLSLARVPLNKIEKYASQITATKLHAATGDTDTDIFTDADLCILGKNWEEYLCYCNQVREEYIIYPDVVYNPGRKKVLQHFLQMQRIFKTGHFFTLYENPARENIRREMQQL